MDWIFASHRNSNPGGPIIFRRKIEGRQSHYAGGERGLGQGWVCGGQYLGPTLLPTRCADELRRPSGPMIFLLVEVLPNDPIHRIGGELRIFSHLRISETDRSACQCVLNANVREKRYKSESNQARCGDRGIRQTLHEADGLCKMVVEVRFRSKDQ